MKQIKKIGAVVSCLLVCGLLAACGAKLDARAYLQAMLDLSYKGDSAAYVEMKLGTRRLPHCMSAASIPK